MERGNILDFIRDVLPLLFSIVAVVVVLYLSYRFSKYLAKKVNTSANSKNVRVLERVALAQDKGLAVVEICGKYSLIGFSANTVSILKDLPDYEVAAPQVTQTQDFMKLFSNAVKAKTNPKAMEKDDVDGKE